MDKTIVYVLSMDFSGSHFLSLMLGSHSRAMHIGEVKALRKTRRSPGKKLCYICEDVVKCPMYQGIRPDNILDVYDILYSNIDPEISVLVDISKKTFWAERFVNDKRYRHKYLHLIRDPRAIVRRWLLKEPKEKWRKRLKIARAFPGDALSILMARPWYVHMYRWLLENRMITEFIQRNHLDSFLLTYHDLARETGPRVEAVMRWIGLEYEPAQLEYWNFQHHGTQKPAYDWVKEKKTRYFDLRWKSFLSEAVQNGIVDHPKVREYIAGLGLTLTGEGLSLLPRR